MNCNNNIYKISKCESEWIDVYRLCLVAMVVFLHSNSEGMDFANSSVCLYVPLWLKLMKYTISVVISECAVPAFFFISSILLFKKDFSWKDNIEKKIKTLLIPYLIVNSFWILILWLAQHIDYFLVFFPDSHYIISEWKSWQFVDAYVGYITGFPIVYPLWFVRDLFLLNVFAVIIKKVIDRFPRTILLIILAVWIWGISIPIFCISIKGLCFFGLGYYFVKYNIRISKIGLIDKRIIVGLYCILSCMDIILYSLEISHGVEHRICIMVGVMFWLWMVIRINKFRSNHIILVLSKYSFFVYLFHEMTLSILKKICMAYFPQTVLVQILEYTILPTLVIALCISFGIFIHQFIPQLYQVISGGR